MVWVEELVSGSDVLGPEQKAVEVEWFAVEKGRRDGRLHSTEECMYVHAVLGPLGWVNRLWDAVGVEFAVEKGDRHLTAVRIGGRWLFGIGASPPFSA